MSRLDGWLGSPRMPRSILGITNSAAIFLALFLMSTALRAEPQIEFAFSGKTSRASTLSELRRACPEREVDVDDPYHGRRMSYFALSMRCVVDFGFREEGGAERIRGERLLLTALDGYTRPVSGADVLASGGALAYGEVALMSGPDSEPRFSLIDRRQVNPAPFYLIWSEPGQSDPHTYPWPYQLAKIEVASFEVTFPRTVPTDLPEDDLGWLGYAHFQRACASCHSMNGQGGKIGPDLNVPMSIVEYRPIEQIRNYIRDPEATRYTNMPAHPELSDADLDALIAYFQAMRNRKQDPRAGDDP